MLTVSSNPLQCPYVQSGCASQCKQACCSNCGMQCLRTESADGTILFKFGSEAEAAAAGGPAAAPELPAQSAQDGPGEPAAAASEPALSHAPEAPAPVEAAAPQGWPSL